MFINKTGPSQDNKFYLPYQTEKSLFLRNALKFHNIPSMEMSAFATIFSPDMRSKLTVQHVHCIKIHLIQKLATYTLTQ